MGMQRKRVIQIHCNRKGATKESETLFAYSTTSYIYSTYIQYIYIYDILKGVYEQAKLRIVDYYCISLLYIYSWDSWLMFGDVLVIFFLHLCLCTGQSCF